MPPVVDGRTVMSSCRMTRDQQIGYQLSDDAFVPHENWTLVPDTSDVTSRLSGAQKTRRKSPRTCSKDYANMSTSLSVNDSSSGQLDNQKSYADHVTKWLREQTCDGNVRRRRQVSRRQRVAANDRERRRMHLLNDAFDRLRETIPVTPSTNGARVTPLSRIQTLRLAIDYIAYMANTLDRTSEPIPSYQGVLTTEYEQQQQQLVSLENIYNQNHQPSYLDQINNDDSTNDVMLHYAVQYTGYHAMTCDTTQNNDGISFAML